MQTSSFVVKATLLATLIASGHSFAQNLPDEINHPYYLKIYQGLETVLNQKVTEYNKLAGEKAELEKLISQMEKDQVALPARNQELSRFIAAKKQEVATLNTQLSALEESLASIQEKLNQAEALMAQHQGDLNAEAARLQGLKRDRQVVAQDVAQKLQIAQRERQSQQQSEQVLRGLNIEIQTLTKEWGEQDMARRSLMQDVERMKRDVVVQRNQLNSSNQLLNSKKTQLTQTQSKLPGIKADISANEAKLPGIDGAINPKQAQLTGLKNDLAARMPEVVKLEKENADLVKKIEATKGKIAATGYTGLVAKKTKLGEEIAALNAKIKKFAEDMAAVQESMKADRELKRETEEALKVARDPNEIRRLQAKLRLVNERLQPKEQELVRLRKLHEEASLAVAPKNMELNNITTTIATLEPQVTGLEQEITNAEAKISANNTVIAQNQAANAGLIKQIADLEAEINKLRAEKTQIQSTIASLRQTESTLTAQVNALNGEIAQLERDVVGLSNNIVAMDKAIADFPMNLRRIELHMNKLNETITQKKFQASREEQLLQRILASVAAAEAALQSAQNSLGQYDQAIVQSDGQIRLIQGFLAEDQRKRDGLVRYKDETSKKKQDTIAIKQTAERDTVGAEREYADNEQDINTISVQLPQQRSALSVQNAKVAVAEKSMNDAQAKSEEANTSYQNRLSLYNQHLSAAQSLGSERASVASVDGDKAGRIDAKTQAVKMATENAATHGKWEALLRGYVRGEVSGYQDGFDLGMSSGEEATRGDAAGKVRGAERAKDQAEMVLKPQFYIQEMDRRLKEDEVEKRAGKININNELLMKVMLAKSTLSSPKSDIPELTSEELNQSRQIVTALDSMIEQSSLEIKDVLARRVSLSQARNAYAVLTAGANASNANCSDVYKNVKDFVDACRAMYSSRYQILFGTAHSNAFNAEYAGTFKSQVETTFNAELNRLYPGYLKEATAIGKQVGVTNGQKEIFRQSFERAERASYAANLPIEEERVENESIAMVSEHLSKNAALTIKGNGKLTSNSIYGIAPGTQLDLSMIMKNIGEVPSLGDSMVRITEASSNLVLDRKEAPVSSVASKSAMNVNIMKLLVSENAVPGSRVVLAGQIIHPGNRYSANRVENFRIESVIEVNPSLTASFDYDNSPKVAGIFGGIKEHEIEASISPKFAGIQNYEVSLEEVGTNFVSLVTGSVQTGALNKGSTKKVSLSYKMSKAAKGKTLTLKVSVKHNSKVVDSFDLKVEAH